MKRLILPFCITTIPHTNRPFFVVLLMDKSMFVNLPLGVCHSIHMAFVTVCRAGVTSVLQAKPLCTRLLGSRIHSCGEEHIIERPT